MNVAVFGLGYVGTVTAACLGSRGHRVTGIDTNQAKVDKFNRGQSPVLEPGVSELLAEGLAEGRLRATNNATEAVLATDMALICVGTPSRPNGDIDLGCIDAVAGQIGEALAAVANPRYVVVIRSTVLPGTAERVGQILADRSGRALGTGISVAVNPEFLREGQGVADFMDPSLILVGADDHDTAQLVLELYHGIDATRRVEPTRLAEMVKYVNNSWHATKVTFANEIGVVSQALGIDGRDVMDILCSDVKLNISRSYLRPGFAFGGSCLPKDVRALTFAAKALDVATPLLGSLLNSNGIHIERLVELLVRHETRKIGFVGLAFKAGTDDLRESPMVEVVERLAGKGFDCSIYDADVSAPDLVGGNRAYIEGELPHLERLLVSDLAELVGSSGAVVVSKTTPELVALLCSRAPDQLVVDLVGLDDEVRAVGAYHGAAW
jgi:GDP-mannose 6-dehydrogenase